MDCDSRLLPAAWPRLSADFILQPLHELRSSGYHPGERRDPDRSDASVLAR